MGQTKSKEGKRKKVKNTQPQETSDPSDPNAPKPTPEVSNGTTPDGETNGTPVEGQDDETSSSSGGEEEVIDDPIIFSKNKQVVSKDDFELLTVIGKGSFGKVSKFVLDNYSHSPH
jgi:hypothetical protein